MNSWLHNGSMSVLFSQLTLRTINELFSGAISKITCFVSTFLLLGVFSVMLGRKVAGLWHGDVGEAVMAWANSLAMFLLMLGSSVQPLDGAYSYCTVKPQPAWHGMAWHEDWCGSAT